MELVVGWRERTVVIANHRVLILDDFSQSVQPRLEYVRVSSRVVSGRDGVEIARAMEIN